MPSSAPAVAQPAVAPIHGAAIGQPRGAMILTNPVDGGHADPFAVLDSAPAAPPATWLHAGPNRAEAGYLDPALGWVAVRAEAPGNALHASIVPASPEAAQVLGSHLASLNSYLADHRGAPAQLSIASPESGQSLSGQSGFDPSGRQPGQQEQQHGDPSSAAFVTRATPARATDPSSAPHRDGLETLAVPDSSGGHISLIA